MPNDMVQQLDEEDRAIEPKLQKEGRWASKAFLPSLQAHGPSLPPADHPACAEMFAKMQHRRPSDETAFTQLQGSKRTAESRTTPTLWWHKDDMPAFVMQAASGFDAGAGAFSMKGLAAEAARLHVTAIVIVCDRTFL